MRDILSKLTAGSMIAGAALLVAACNGETDTTTENVVVNDFDTEFGNDLGMDNTMDMNAMGMDNMTGNGVDAALENAAEATQNAQEAIENAQERAE